MRKQKASGKEGVVEAEAVEERSFMIMKTKNHKLNLTQNQNNTIYIIHITVVCRDTRREPAVVIAFCIIPFSF